MAQTQNLWVSCYSNWKKFWYISEFDSEFFSLNSPLLYLNKNNSKYFILQIADIFLFLLH